MATKVTYTLDDQTVERVRRMAQRTRKPQSQIVREAVAYYEAREDKLTPEETERMLDILRTLGPQLPVRTQEDVDRELGEIRKSRRTGYSRPSDSEE
jgi:predicted DNA-binding protein